MKYLFLLTFLSIFVLSCENENPPNSQTTKSNILLIIADDFGLDACPNYPIGNIKPNMPNLEKMMQDGITFDNFWSFPVCSPTRASILTGKYGVKTGVLNASNAATIKSSEKTLHQFLDEKTNAAYAHSIIGKWHLSNNEPNRPTEMGIGYYAGILGGGVSSYSDWQLVENGQSSNSTDYITTKISDLAIDWIEEQNKPWFCWLAYTAPHTPFHLPPAHMHTQGDLPEDEESIEANPTPYYMAMLESLDYEIGRVLASLSEEERKNTTIIFIGDNGTPGQVIQSPFVSNRSKGSIYQGGIAVPLVVSGDGVSRKGVRDESLINSTDLFTTIAQMAGSDQLTYENSNSFFPLLTQKKSHSRVYNYSEVLNNTPTKTGYTIRNATNKLLILDNGAERFYDLSVDPFENDNLINKLSTAQQAEYELLKTEVAKIRN